MRQSRYVRCHDLRVSMPCIDTPTPYLTTILQYPKYARSLLPRTIKKVARASRGGQEWPEWVTDICLEMLSHRTPPESIPANIMTICKLISPNNNIVQELPGVDWVRKCRSIMVVETKTLGAMQIAAADATVGHHADDTSRRGKGFGNCIVRVRNGPVFSNVALSSCIFAADGTAESGVALIQRTFREGRELL